MKFILLFSFLLAAFYTNAQKYVLLDKRIAQPVAYSNTITSADRFNGLFPVEKNSMKQFVNALEEIAKMLSVSGTMPKPKNYQIGCAKFTGHIVQLGTGERLDYVITSTCDNIKISMHLSDAKLRNASNAYFINTWISYIKSAGK